MKKIFYLFLKERIFDQNSFNCSFNSNEDKILIAPVNLEV